jgi:hypothetical protein
MKGVRTYARVAGVLFLLSIICGGFGEVFVPSKLIVAGDAAATAQNLRASDGLFRLGFASYLIEAACDIGITWILYVLLAQVDRHLALLAAFFGLVSTAVFACAELFYFVAPLAVKDASYLKAFSPQQLQTLSLLSLKVYGYGGGIFMVFYGIATILRGYLIARSRFLPKALGILLSVAGLGFVVRNFALVIFPAYASDLFLLPMFLAGVSLTVWLLVKGVNVSKFEEAASGSAAAL